MIDLSICSVSFHNRPHLSLNWHLSRRLNEDFDRCRWIIAENTPDGAATRLDADDRRFTLLPGASPKLIPNYQHTEALQGCLEQVDTRFVLVLDPDFYIVRPHWMRDVLDRMVERKLSFFGVPWHPRNTDKYRYFPCVHCLFVDQERFPLAKLDLRPDREDQPVTKYRPQFRPETPSAPASASLAMAAVEALWRASGLNARRKNYCDTGTRFYYSYHHDFKHPFEMALPVLRLPEESPVHLSWRGRVLEALLPDSLCYLPKRRDSYTRVGFREHGLLEAAPSDWEQFMWQDAPFGFHVRRNRDKRTRDKNAEVAALMQIADELVPGVASEAAPLPPARPAG